MEPNLKKIKTYHRKKKVKRVKSLYVHKKSSGQQATSERRDDDPRIFTNSPRNNTPSKRGNTFNLVQRASVTQRTTIKVNSNPDAEGSNAPNIGSVSRRKVLRKRRTKRKKSTAPNITPAERSGIDWQDP